MPVARYPDHTRSDSHDKSATSSKFATSTLTPLSATSTFIVFRDSDNATTNVPATNNPSFPSRKRCSSGLGDNDRTAPDLDGYAQPLVPSSNHRVRTLLRLDAPQAQVASPTRILLTAPTLGDLNQNPPITPMRRKNLIVPGRQKRNGPGWGTVYLPGGNQWVLVEPPPKKGKDKHEVQVTFPIGKEIDEQANEQYSQRRVDQDSDRSDSAWAQSPIASDLPRPPWEKRSPRRQRTKGASQPMTPPRKSMATTGEVTTMYNQPTFVPLGRTQTLFAEDMASKATEVTPTTQTPERSRTLRRRQSLYPWEMSKLLADEKENELPAIGPSKQI